MTAWGNGTHHQTPLFGDDAQRVAATANRVDAFIETVAEDLEVANAFTDLRHVIGQVTGRPTSSLWSYFAKHPHEYRSLGLRAAADRADRRRALRAFIARGGVAAKLRLYFVRHGYPGFDQLAITGEQIVRRAA